MFVSDISTFPLSSILFALSFSFCNSFSANTELFGILLSIRNRGLIVFIGGKRFFFWGQNGSGRILDRIFHSSCFSLRACQKGLKISVAFGERGVGLHSGRIPGKEKSGPTGRREVESS